LKVSFKKSSAGLPVVILNHSSGSTATVHFHGAHVTSWTINGEDQLFVSRKAIFKDGKAIRGGIPIIWPQFGPGSIVNHGFARDRTWKIQEVKQINGDVQVSLTLEDDENTRKIWNHRFILEYIVKLSDTQLFTTLRVTNKDTESFNFQAAFHTYYKVSNIRNVEIFGLKGLEYIDKVRKAEKFQEKKMI